MKKRIFLLKFIAFVILAQGPFFALAGGAPAFIRSKEATLIPRAQAIPLAPESPSEFPPLSAAPPPSASPAPPATARTTTPNTTKTRTLAKNPAKKSAPTPFAIKRAHGPRGWAQSFVQKRLEKKIQKARAPKDVSNRTLIIIIIIVAVLLLVGSYGIWGSLWAILGALLLILIILLLLKLLGVI